VHAQRFPKHQYRLYRGADRISTVSEAIAAAICEQVPDLAHIVRVIPNPVDVSVFRPTCRCLEGSRGNGATRTILFTGRIHPEKGLELLVRAFTLMHRADQRVRLVLVGPTELEYGGGGASFVRALKALAAGAPIEMRASIANPVELASTLRSCDVYCYPSIAVHGEASPVAPLEAMACGAVPVVSDLPQFAGYIRDGETGLVFAREAPDAVERLAACLRGVMDAPERASALRAAGVARAKELSVERVAEAHLVDFKRLVDARCGDYSGR
jgi:glycosyltransferase involved in cell wall biosynthesis